MRTIIDDQGVEWDDPDEYGEDDQFDRDRLDLTKEVTELFPDLAPSVALKAERLAARMLDSDGLDNQPDPEPLVAGILTRNTLAVTYGKPGSLKSAFALDLGLCVSSGSYWHGHAVHQGPMVYIVAEGAAGMKARKNAWMTYNRVHQLPGAYWLPVPVNLMDTEWSAATVAVVATYNPVLVIIDTLSRTMPGANENAPEVMSRYVDNADRIRTATGATVNIIAHTPKDGGSIRGHSALEGAADTTIECTRTGGIVTLTNTKQKDAAEFEPIRLALVEVSGSCTLDTPIRAVGVTDADPESERVLLKAAWESCGSDGLATGVLLKVSGLSETTFYRARKALVERGALVNLGTERQPRYVPAEGSAT